MPILSKKENPPSKTFDCPISEKEGTWWLAKVKPRQEKTLAFDLLTKGVDYYLPYFEKVSKRSDGRNRKSYIVLFPTYLPFIATEPYKIFDRNKMLSILPIEAQTRFRNQLACVDSIFTAGCQVYPVERNCELHIGDIVKVVAGPCNGLVGRIVKFKHCSHLIFTVEGMGNVFVSVLDSQVELQKKQYN